MRRLFMPLVVAAFAVGCGERAIVPTSPLTPRAALLDDGTPPPPPISGDGSLSFDASRATDGSSAGDCSAVATIPLSFHYLANNPGNNEFLHLDFGPGPNVDVHQTDNGIDTKGTITGPGFTFMITNTLKGDISAPHGQAPSSVFLVLQGTLTVGDVTCTANASVTVTLGHSSN
jgi:hypothetical protein